ncbi:MAG: Type 1 glutamine amidotransferase-like domain-containing protein [Anaerolineae bacterium]|nr:Type 1 glutamine amidotransferase-like domain-containing protein [Anaerolineae bacterium]
MHRQGPIHWLEGEGWLVLSGGGDWQHGETDLVDAQILSLVNLDRPMIVLLSEGTQERADMLLEHFTLLGGPGGEAFTLSQMTREQLDTPALLSLLSEAGLIYLGGENPLPLVRTLFRTRALEYIVNGFTTLQQLTIVGTDGGASALGAWMLSPILPEPVQGFGFLPYTLIVPHFTGTEATPMLRHTLQTSTSLLGLGIPNGTALALGPAEQDCRLETWGVGEITAVVNASLLDDE